MKKLFSLFLVTIFLTSLVPITVFADETTDKETVYDSVKIPEEEIKQKMPTMTNYHVLNYVYKRCDGDYDRMSAQLGYDAKRLFSTDEFIKLYNCDLRDVLASGGSVVDAANSATDNGYIKFLPENTEGYRMQMAWGTSESTYNADRGFYIRMYDYVINGEALFSIALGSECPNDIEIQNVYAFEAKDMWEFGPVVISFMIYYVTNYGDYVFYHENLNFGSSEYFFPAEKFIELSVARQSLIDYIGYTANTDYYEIYDDISEYMVGEQGNVEFLEELVDGHRLSYALGKGMGFETRDELDDALKAGGYKNDEIFLKEMESAGYTTYEEYRIALDAAIVANAHSSDSETMPADTEKSAPTPSKLWHLAWIIPVAVLVPIGVVSVVIAEKKRKRGNV